jgi:hypothetical protein
VLAKLRFAVHAAERDDYPGLENVLGRWGTVSAHPRKLPEGTLRGQAFGLFKVRIRTLVLKRAGFTPAD